MIDNDLHTFNAFQSSQSIRKPVQDDWSDDDLPTDKPSKPTQSTRKPTTNDWTDLLNNHSQSIKPQKTPPSRNVFSDLFDDPSPPSQPIIDHEEIAQKRRKLIESYLSSIPNTSFLSDTIINLRY